MKIINLLKDNFYKLLFLALLSIAECTYAVEMIFDIQHSFLMSFAAVIGTIIVVVLIISLPKKFSVPIFAMLLFAVIYLLYRFSEPVTEIMVLGTNALLKRSFVQVENSIIVLYAISFFFLMINYLFIGLLNKNILAVILSIGIVYFIYYSYNHINTYLAIFYLSSIMLITMRSIASQITNKGEFLVPFNIILLAVIIVAPLSVFVSTVRPEPLKWIDELDWFEGDGEGQHTKQIVRIDGQSKLTNLTDEFNYSDSKMMIVTTPYIERLRNQTYDVYTEEGWRKSQLNSAPNLGYQYDVYEIKEILDAQNVPSEYYNMSVELSAHSEIIFAPLNSQLITELDEIPIENSYGDLYLSEALPTGTVYDLNVLDIDYKTNEFINFISSSESENIDNLENYLTIPDEMKEHLQPITLELVKDADSNYLKAKIIESYLSNNYTYNLYPPEKPINEDFVEYFLFETKEGFCTHYASSMVMMLRSIGIPCRYVTGYLMDVPDNDMFIPGESPEDMMFVEGEPKEFVIQKRNSHAWVEVWFDDFGWLTYEPTSKFESALGFVSVISYDDIEMIKTPDVIEETKNNNIVILIVIVAVVLVLVSILLVRLYLILRKPTKKNIAAIFNRIRKYYYKKFGIRKLNETAREFCNRADSSNVELSQALVLYEKALYSKMEIDKSHIKRMLKIYKIIRKSDYKNNTKM